MTKHVATVGDHVLLAALSALTVLVLLVLLSGCMHPHRLSPPVQVSPAHDQCVAAGRREDCEEWRR